MSPTTRKKKRGFVKKRLMSLGLTLGAIVFMVIMLGIVAVLPPLLKAVFGTGVLRWVFQILGWLVSRVARRWRLAILGAGADRDAPRMAWVSVGAIVATVLARCSIGFSIYTLPSATTPRPMAFSPESWCCCSGSGSACTRSCSVPRSKESEQQTIEDTTKGQEKPLGESGAVKADSVPSGDPEAPQHER